jgi:NAD(P)-dependent dehydrogenase (short-subunit alcohol dehydrogenase family)
LGVPIEEIMQRVIARTALRRLTHPRDVAKVVVFLASDLSSFVTGESIAVTGGVF